MALQIYITDSKQLDIEKYCQLQRAAFADVFAKSGIDTSYLDTAFFTWKYNPPAGPARIAVAEENGKLLASVAMYPVELLHNKKIKQGWHFVEAAVLPEARGRRLFPACMSILMESLMNDELIYVFPNRNSFAATEKIGFRQLEEVPFRTGICRRKEKGLNFEASALFLGEQDEYAQKINAEKRLSIYRSADYMNWRYIQHPHAEYYCYSAVDAGIVGGNIVIRPICVKGIRMLLLMEAHAVDNGSAKKINLFLRQVAATERCSLIGMFSNNPMKFGGATGNLIRVPSFLLPKKQVLMQYEKQSVSNAEWLIQTGDWDAF
ncbi:GNAT family N-acetyltransferase [Lacibacter luteus]|uniref:GNAT family N-acetyltransferase n=1 Tax=Lacibacter luteus TaxID=2508719 RepID=A0A4Q1CP80_9BACT|nr:GNAT family N-acetyltransferase [Lacibacter luteus]RXK62449.1 GNAT family N-acetyltransferase [Lacibacter luteus]